MKARFRKLIRIVGVSLVACFVMAGAALAASTVTMTAPANGATSVSGSAALDGSTSAAYGSGHTYTVDGGATQSLTLSGNAFSVPVSALADGSHTVAVSIMIDEDGPGAAVATAHTASQSFTMTAGAVSVASPPSGGSGLQFTIPTSGLGTAVGESITSLSPLFTIAAGLVIAGAALGWGISMIKKWRS
jgi:hypothetical protein